MMSVYNLVHALILSGLIGVALTPLDPAGYPGDRENFVHAFNVLVSLVFVCSGFCVCTTTWALANVSSLTPETAFRFAIHSDAWWVQEFLSCIEMLLLIVASVIAVWIRNSTLISAIISVLTFMVMQIVMTVHHKWMLQADAHVGWSYAMGGGLKYAAAGKEAERVGGMLAERVEQSRRVEGAVMGATEDIPAAATTDAAHAKMLASLGQLVEQVRNGLQSPMQPMISQRIS